MQEQSRICSSRASCTVLGMSTDRFQQPASRPHGQDSLAERFQTQHTNELALEAEQVQPDAANAPRTHDAVSQSAPAEQGSGWGNPDVSQSSAQPQQPQQQAQAPNFGQQPAAPAPGQQPQHGFPQQSYGQPGYPQQAQQNAQFQPNQPFQSGQPRSQAAQFGMIALALVVISTVFAAIGRFALALAGVHERLMYTVINLGEGVASLAALALAIAGLINFQTNKTPQAGLWVGLGLGAAGLQLLNMILGLMMSLAY